MSLNLQLGAMIVYGPVDNFEPGARMREEYLL